MNRPTSPIMPPRTRNFHMRYYAIPLMRERLLMLKDRFRFIDWEPEQGPGRTDTFNPAKTLVNYPLEKMETREIVGLCDLPSIWLQGPRRDHDMVSTFFEMTRTKATKVTTARP